MAKCVRCRRGGQAKLTAGHLGDLLHQTRIERAAACPQKQGIAGFADKRAQFQIIIDGLSRDRQDRNQPLLVALAGDPDDVGQRRLTAGQRKGLGNAQARAVKQRQHGNVAGRLPVGTVLEFNRRDQVAGRIGGDWPGQTRVEARTAYGQGGSDFGALGIGQPSVEAFYRG